MPFSPDQPLTLLVAQLLGRRRETAALALRDRRDAVKADFARRNIDGAGFMVAKIEEEFAVIFRDFAAGSTQDLIDVAATLPDPEGIAWVRAELDKALEGFARGLASAAREGAPSGPEGGSHDSSAGLLNGARRDANIAFELAFRQRGALAPVAIDEARLDPLVALRNRRAFDEDLPRVMGEAKKDQSPVALVQIDVDQFKQINDQGGGHAIGDEALKQIASIAESCAKGKGNAYRVGGDEFALLLPNHSINEAVSVAERFRSAVAEKPLTSKSLRVTASVGIAVSPEHGNDPASLQKHADEAAYDSKKLGRNLVRVFGEPAQVAPVRQPQPRQPESGALSDGECADIRLAFFRDGLARCPRDQAVLDVEDVTTFGDKTKRIYVTCPLCGAAQEIR